MENKSSFTRRFKSAVYSNIPFVAMLLVFVVVIGIYMELTKIKSEEKKIEIAEIAKSALQKRTNIEIANIKPSEIVDSLILPGIVESWESVTIKAEVTGRITEILKDEGDFVKKGDVIARIDNREYVAAVKEAKANVDKAESDLERNKELFKKKVISQSKYDSIVAPALSAEAKFDKAKLNLDRTEIKASFDGVINKRYIQLGALVSSGTSIVDILDISKVRVNVFIPERDVRKVAKLEKAKIFVNDDKDISMTGTKIFLSQEPTDGAQAYNFQMKVDNSDGILRPGMFVESEIIRGVKENAIVLPIYAVIPVGNHAFCYVEEDGVARIREVKTGIISGDKIEVVSGLSSSDNVVIKGQRQLEDGELVEVVKSYN